VRLLWQAMFSNSTEYQFCLGSEPSVKKEYMDFVNEIIGFDIIKI